MGRRTKFPAEALDLVRGVAGHAFDELEKAGRPTTEKSLKVTMVRIAMRGGTPSREDLIHRWLHDYGRTAQRDQLIQWGYLDPAPRLTTAPQLTTNNLSETATATEGPESANGRARPPTFPHSGDRPWADMSSNERLALVSRILRDDRLSMLPRLQRLGPLDVERLLNSMACGAYRGDGVSPHEEIRLLSLARAYGGLPWPSWSEGGDRLACRVTLSLEWPPHFRLEDRTLARNRFTLRSILRRWFSWYIPWLA